MTHSVPLEVDGRDVVVTDDGGSLLDALRDQLGVRSVKDGCSPQGQCGCCTVLVDDTPRVACVTPLARVAGRRITTLDGLPEADRRAWAGAFCATGASQCGFCTPGIIVRLHAARAKGAVTGADPRVAQALLAHLCRCTGWRTILDAVDAVDAMGAPAVANAAGGPAPAALGSTPAPVMGATPDDAGATTPAADRSAGRDLAAAARRATLEGGAAQRVGPDVALGRGGFADDGAPADALVAVRSAEGTWVVAESVGDARRRAGKVQGRRTTAPLAWPVPVPPGDWAVTLQTTWVEPAYLEPDASWCAPGGEPASPLANGGAFGGKAPGSSEVTAVARRLADEHGRPVRVLWSREDVVRLGPKRPPLGAGVRADGTGAVCVIRTPGIAAAIVTAAPGFVVTEVDVPGPPTSAAVRAAGWAEAAVLLSAVAAGAPAGDGVTVVAPGGGRATARVDGARALHVEVEAGDPLDEVVVRSYAVGAAHQALGWVRHEGISVDGEGVVHDLTIRSFGILRAAEMPTVHVAVRPGAGPPVPVGDAVFAAVAAAVWRHDGFPPRWPAART